MALYYTMIRIALHFPIMKLYFRKRLLPPKGNCGLPRHPNPERIYNPTVPSSRVEGFKSSISVMLLKPQLSLPSCRSCSMETLPQPPASPSPAHH